MMEILIQVRRRGWRRWMRRQGVLTPAGKPRASEWEKVRQ